MIAVVECFMANRGFGFLRTGDGQDFFFHVSNFKGTPHPGATVSFDIAAPVRLGQRPQATNIQIVQDCEFDVLAGSKKGVEGGAQ